HGLAFRKFSRTSSHRMLMLRNLVITLGKQGTHPAWKKVSSYTRIHKFGHRPGDNAPHAVLELVDGPRDIKFEMAARATGWDVLSSRLLRPRMEEEERRRGHQQRPARRAYWSRRAYGISRDGATISVYGDVKRFEVKVKEHIDTLLARPVAIKTLRERSEKESGEADQQYFRSIKDYKLKAGETVPGAAGSALRRAHGDLGWAPGRKVRWFERRKLGIDRPLTWEQV
ncbi:hypothetical protein BGW80DRAFT_1281610, partial [Lactifluus volemus]